MRTSTTVTARVTLPGLHRWPEARGERIYLASRHRHLFVIEAEVEVAHDGRDIEFHDLAQRLTASAWAIAQPSEAGLADFGNKSCETLARELTGFLPATWRRVSWSEDGEFTATLYREDR